MHYVDFIISHCCKHHSDHTIGPSKGHTGSQFDVDGMR